MAHRIQSGYWKRLSADLCDRNINFEGHGESVKTVVRPAMMYDAET